MTLTVSLSALVGLLVYDLVLLLSHGTTGTISYQLLAVSLRQPIVPALVGLAVGLVLGHLFWRI